MRGLLQAFCSPKLVIIHTISAALAWAVAFLFAGIDWGLAIQSGFLATMIIECRVMLKKTPAILLEFTVPATKASYFR